jgi:hypothetical protein
LIATLYQVAAQFQERGMLDVTFLSLRPPGINGKGQQDTDHDCQGLYNNGLPRDVSALSHRSIRVSLLSAPLP